MKSFKPVKQSRISEEVSEQLKQSIINGDYKPGEKLPSERDLSTQFQVSRVSVREALRKLENLGFIEIRQGITGGSYITDLSFEYMADSFMDLFSAGKISISEFSQLALMIEPVIARMAASAITPEYSRRLKEAYKKEATKPSSLHEGYMAVTAVHRILAEMSGNRLAEAIVNSITRLGYQVLTVVGADPNLMNDFHPPKIHQPIVEAVLSGDPDAACEAMRKHIAEISEVVNGLEKSYFEKKIRPKE